MPIRARRRRASASSSAAVRSVPSTSTRPVVACSSPPMIIRRDDLPEPEGPVTATRSPRAISRVMSRRISTLPAALGKVSPSLCSFITGSLMSAARSPVSARYAATLLIRKLAIVALFLAMPISSVEATPLRLIAVGDSLVSGYGLPADQGFTAQLQGWLEEHGRDVEVVNMGVAGDTTTGGLARLEWALAEGADAVILELGGNDILRGTPPRITRANLDAMLTELGAREIPVLLAGIAIPLNFGLAWQVDFEGQFAKLAEKHGTLLYPSFMDGVWTRPELMQQDMLHPNERGVAHIVERIGPLVLNLLERVP